MIILWHGCNIMVHVIVVNVEVIILKLKYMDLWFSYLSINILTKTQKLGRIDRG